MNKITLLLLTFVLFAISCEEDNKDKNESITYSITLRNTPDRTLTDT